MRNATAAVFLLLLMAGCQPDHFQPGQGPSTNPSADPAPSLLQTGYIWRNGSPRLVVYELVGGLAVIGGDIIIGRANDIAPTMAELLHRGVPQAGVALDDLWKRWPSGTVPFTFHSAFNDTVSAASAMAMITARAFGVSFVPKQSHHSDYVRFEVEPDTTRCASSALGRTGGMQVLKATSLCSAIPGVLAHELGHALGLYHEHQRCDRDSYVTVYPDSIDYLGLSPLAALAHFKDNWEKKCDDVTDYAGYNPWSIMHYDSTQGGIKHGATRALVISGGRYNRDTLTLSDGTTLNLLYQPPVVQSGVVTNQSGSPLFSWAASPNATSYSVDFVVEYQYNDDLNSIIEISDVSIDGVGSTSSTSILDSGHSYTGNSNCEYYRDTYSTIFYNYYYEITAHYPGGIESVKRRFPAPVGSSGYPCASP